MGRKRMSARQSAQSILLATALQEDEDILYPIDPSLRFKTRFDDLSIAIHPNFRNTRKLTMSLVSDDSQETVPTSISLAPLQDTETVEAKHGYKVLSVDDPTSFDLVEPATAAPKPTYSIEKRVDVLLSKQHLEAIFADARLFLKFTTFLSKYRPASVPLLIYYLDSLKALKAISYSNAIVEGLERVSFADFTASPPSNSANASLQEKADQAFATLVQEDLPAYITHVFVDIVSVSIHRKITNTMAPQLREASEGLAEVFCMSDISKPDQPIVFSSEEFHKTTQYGLNYAVGRNCRFLQGPNSDPHAVQRLRESIRNGREHQDILINYRRDGSPFMNLLTMAPLLDNQGRVRYYIGAQVDISGLVKDCTSLEAFAKLVADQESLEKGNALTKPEHKKDELQALSEMFNQSELETVRVHGGRMHSEQHDLDDTESVRASNRPRLLIREPSGEEEYQTADGASMSSRSGSASPIPGGVLAGRLPGVFTHYLILRPHPSLRITFTSPSLRVPGLLQSPFLSRIGGAGRVREELALALSEGRNVTAKIRWLKERYDETIDERMADSGSSLPLLPGKHRWIHCTPLLGINRVVGAWMVIMIDADDFENVKVHQDRVGVVSPSWGRPGQMNHASTKPKDSGYIAPSAAIRSVRPQDNTKEDDWDMDLDIAAAVAYDPPVTQAGQSLRSTYNKTNSRSNDRARSHSSALASPMKSIPLPMPPPVPSKAPVQSSAGLDSISRSAAGVRQSNEQFPQPLGSHRGPTTPTASSFPHPPPQPPQTGTTSTLPSRTSILPKHNIPQAIATQTAAAASQVLPPSSPTVRNTTSQQNLPQLHSKPSSETLGSKKSQSFGSRMLGGFLKSNSSSDREKQRANLKERDRERARAWDAEKARQAASRRIDRGGAEVGLAADGNGTGNGNGNGNGNGGGVSALPPGVRSMGSASGRNTSAPASVPRRSVSGSGGSGYTLT